MLANELPPVESLLSVLRSNWQIYIYLYTILAHKPTLLNPTFEAQSQQHCLIHGGIIAPHPYRKIIENKDGEGNKP